VMRIGAIELIFLFAPLVIVPLGMELGRVIGGLSWLGEIARRAQPLGALCAVGAMWVGPGRRAGLMALGWMVVCGFVAGEGVVGMGRVFFEKRTGEAPVATWSVATWSVATRPSASFSGLALAIARIDLAVGGAWLVASRLGMRPMEIQEPIGLLTAVHFHYAGFATATIAASMLAIGRGEKIWLQRVTVMVAGLPFVVAAGFVISPVLKMAAAVLFSVSVAGLAVLLRGCATRVQDPAARRLLQTAAGAVFAGMVLSTAYAVADFAGSDAIVIPWMARTHGLLNSIGFCLPGLLGWSVESSK
jgi:hypothetical protein